METDDIDLEEIRTLNFEKKKIKVIKKLINFRNMIEQFYSIIKSNF